MGSGKAIDLGSIYPTYEPEQRLPVPELPSHRIEVKLSLRRTIEEDWFLRMESHLQSNNMKVTEDRNNTILVAGTPPDYNFNQQNVLEIVQEYDSGAQMISFEELQM